MYLKKKNYFTLMCTFFMMLGVYLGMNSMSWLMMWMSMEITLMSFIPRLIMNKSLIESFSCLKYFIFQCLGSIFFILGSMDMYFINTFGLFMKLGLFPNHFWMLMMVKGMNWTNFFFLMSIQKILPLMFMIFSMKFIINIFLFIIIFNSFIANLGSLNQMDLRFLMVFSSMNHMTWLILCSNLNYLYFYVYFFCYSLLIYFMCIYFNKVNIFYIFQMFSLLNFSLNFNLIFLMLIFFSFLGFPPLMGFFLKLMTLFSMMNFYFLTFMIILLLQNLIISFSYMRVVIYLFMNLTRSINMIKFYNISFYFSLMNLFMLTMLI